MPICLINISELLSLLAYKTFNDPVSSLHNTGVVFATALFILEVIQKTLNTSQVEFCSTLQKVHQLVISEMIDKEIGSYSVSKIDHKRFKNAKVRLLSWPIKGVYVRSSLWI